MKIQTLPLIAEVRATEPRPPVSAEIAPPGDTYTPEVKPQPKKYEPLVPLANAATVAALVGIPAALGALEHSLFGPVAARALTAAATPLIAGGLAGTWAYRNSMKEFNKHPILVGMTTLITGGAAALISPFLKMPGAAWGWQGAAIATGVAATAAGVISAIGIHKANQAAEQAAAKG